MKRKTQTKTAPAVMTEVEINTRLSALVVAMMAKGLREPEAQVWIKANEGVSVYLKWKTTVNPDYYSGDSKSEFLRGASAAEALSEAFDFVSALPSPEQAKFDEFMQAVATAVDLGRKNGIDVAFVNPLEKMMLDLSKNALTFQKAVGQ